MPECRNCGGHVTARFRRVFGGNDGEVYACRGCADVAELINGAAAVPRG